MSTRDCIGEGCTLEVSLRSYGGHDYACAEHARRFNTERLKRDGALTWWCSLLHPLAGRLVILRDAPVESTKRRIILPKTAFNALGQQIHDVYHEGIVVAVGPGWFARRGLTGDWLGKDGVGKRMPIDVRLGDHVAFQTKHEAAATEWRGLTIIYDHALLLETPQAEEAAQ